MIAQLAQLAADRTVALVGAAIAALILLVFVRRVAKHARPDDLLSRVAVVLGLGWSSEAAWELMAGFPTSVRVAIFAVGEVILMVSMIRVSRAVRETGRAGRAGRAVWIVASGMAVVGLLAADSFGQGILRALVPLGLTLMWWQGVVPEGAERSDGPSSWRWTPRRVLLAIGALEPGERDVETVHRERLTQQLTKLEFKRSAAPADKRGRIEARLSRLSLMADDEMIAVVRERVDRARWFTATPLTHLGDAAGDAADALAKHRLDAGGDAPATQATRRTADAATQALTSTDAVRPEARRGLELHLGGMSLRKAAAKAGTSDAAISRAKKKLTATLADAPEATQRVNGHSLELVKR